MQNAPKFCTVCFVCFLEKLIEIFFKNPTDPNIQKFHLRATQQFPFFFCFIILNQISPISRTFTFSVTSYKRFTLTIQSPIRKTARSHNILGGGAVGLLAVLNLCC